MPTKAFKQRFDYAKAGGSICPEGLLEVCYKSDLAFALLKAVDGQYIEENFLFLIAVNHVMLRKCNITSTLPKAIEQASKLPSADNAKHAIFSTDNDKQSLLSQMQHVMDVFVKPGGLCEVNLKYDTRMALVSKRSAIESAQATQAFMTARKQIVQLALSVLHSVRDNVTFPKQLDGVLRTKWQPTEDAVQKLLGKLRVQAFDFSQN